MNAKAIIVSALVLAFPAAAQEVEPAPIELQQRTQVWLAATATGKLGSIARATFEVQPRFTLRPHDRIDTIVVRGALGVELLPGLTLWQGFAWAPAWPSGRFEVVSPGEGRLYQQLMYTRSFGRVGLLARARLEERVMQGNGGVLFRQRLMVRATWQLTESPAVQLAVHDEVFFNLNERQGSPPQGFDQNRAYAGIGWWLRPGFLFEVGYQHQLVRRVAPEPWRSGHTLLVTTAYTF